MDRLSMLVLIIAANLDNFGVGLSLGARRIQVPLSSNLLIALTTSLGTLCTLFIGRWLAGFFPVETARYLGAAVIIGMGIWVLYQELFEAKKVPPKPPEKKEPAPVLEKNVFQGFKNVLKSPALADTDYSGHIDVKEALFLGGALTLNNFAGGFGAGILGLNPVLTACGMVVFSLLLLWAGVKFGQNGLSRWLGGLAGPVAGFLLVLLGVCGMLV
ncbi:MAG: sporulation membrane protein YtaF [Bacillota bacterium]